MSDEKNERVPEYNLTVTRYMVPSGKGVTEHPRGLLYLRADVDPILEALTAERDAGRVRAEKAEAEQYRLRDGVISDLKAERDRLRDAALEVAAFRAQVTHGEYHRRSLMRALERLEAALRKGEGDDE